MHLKSKLLSSVLLVFIAGVVYAKDDLSVWPNKVSKANSDEWLVKNHDKIAQMRPKLLVLNFVNGLSKEKGMAKVNQLIAALRESSRSHGYRDPKAKPFLEYEVYKFVDLTDAEPPAEKLDGNSTLYPRVPNWRRGINFQYGQLFDNLFARHYGIEDPRTPGVYLDLKELVNRGIIHEVWFLANQREHGSPYESVEVKQVYDENFKKVPDKWVQAGNGGSRQQPFIGRSLRILFINAERGPGCAMESLGHSFEGMSNSKAIPYFTRYFEEFAGFNLEARYGLPFKSLYAKGSEAVSYPTPTTLVYKRGGEEKRLENYLVTGGNVHYTPNGRSDYDMSNPQPVMSTVENYRLRNGKNGQDKEELWTNDKLKPYQELAGDCMGPWVVYWRQSMPGYKSKAKDDNGKPMKNWWVFLFY